MSTHNDVESLKKVISGELREFDDALENVIVTEIVLVRHQLHAERSKTVPENIEDVNKRHSPTAGKYPYSQKREACDVLERYCFRLPSMYEAILYSDKFDIQFPLMTVGYVNICTHDDDVGVPVIVLPKSQAVNAGCRVVPCYDLGLAEVGYFGVRDKE
jgi:hypothetical protein